MYATTPATDRGQTRHGRQLAHDLSLSVTFVDAEQALVVLSCHSRHGVVRLMPAHASQERDAQPGEEDDWLDDDLEKQDDMAIRFIWSEKSLEIVRALGCTNCDTPSGGDRSQERESVDWQLDSLLSAAFFKTSPLALMEGLTRLEHFVRMLIKLAVLQATSAAHQGAVRPIRVDVQFGGKSSSRWTSIRRKHAD